MNMQHAIAFNPVSGIRLKASMNVELARSCWPSPWAYNPWTGAVRAAGDTATDPHCLAVWLDAWGPLRAFTQKDDPVNHPKHYTNHPSGVECITVTEHMGFNVGNAIKYLWRADEKGNAIQDLEKAAWYVNRELEKRKKQLQGTTR